MIKCNKVWLENHVELVFDHLVPFQLESTNDCSMWVLNEIVTISLIRWNKHCHHYNWLQGTFCTCFRRVLHTFWVLPAHALGTSPSGKKGAWFSRMSCCSFIARFYACTDASCVRPRRVLHAFQVCLARVSDAFKPYLGAELYCT